MKTRLIEKGDRKYIVCSPEEASICTVQDGLDLISACMEHGVSLLMLPAESLSEEFFRLRTGLAGEIVQKLITYRIKTAAVLSPQHAVRGKFAEFLAETNKGSDFRTFHNVQEAEDWLLSL